MRGAPTQFGLSVAAESDLLVVMACGYNVVNRVKCSE